MSRRASAILKADSEQRGGYEGTDFRQPVPVRVPASRGFNPELSRSGPLHWWTQSTRAVTWRCSGRDVKPQWEDRRCKRPFSLTCELQGLDARRGTRAWHPRPLLQAQTLGARIYGCHPGGRGFASRRPANFHKKTLIVPRTPASRGSCSRGQSTRPIVTGQWVAGDDEPPLACTPSPLQRICKRGDNVRPIHKNRCIVIRSNRAERSSGSTDTVTSTSMVARGTGPDTSQAAGLLGQERSENGFHVIDGDREA